MKRKTRMYEPWGYQDENNYQGAGTILENDLESFFADVNYKKDDNKIHFQNKDGEEVASLDVNEFVKSDSIIDHTEYKDGILSIYFTNGDVVTIDLTELLDENEFKDGLIVDDHVVKVLIDSESDSKYVSVSENGVKVAGIEADIEAEKARAEGEEQRIETKLDEEIARAISAETALDAKIDAETERAEEAEQTLDEKIDQEIADRTADVDAEETRATNAENALSNRVNALNDELDAEESRAQAAEQELSTKLTTEIADRKADVDEEEARAKAAEESLQNAIDAEKTRAEAAEQALGDKIDQEIADRIADVDAEEARAYSAETELAEGIETLGSIKFDEVVYDSSAKTITFYAEGNVKGEIDTKDFVKDGMIDDVKIEGGNLVIVFNTDAGKERIEIPLTDIFNPANYYDKDAINDIVSGINASIANEATTRAENDEALSQSIDGEKTRAEEKETALQGLIDAEEARALSAETDLQTAIDLKADKETTYTKEEVDALIAEKEAEIVQIKKDYNSLKEIVGELGGNVEWGVPADGTFNNMMKKNGIVKLGEDTTTSTYAGGITSKNETTLNLNGKNLTFSGQTTTNPGIMTRGKQKLTIMGKGTIDAAGRIAVEANGADTVINLSGTTGMFGSEPTYVTDRSGGELIYCYLGTINIYAGVFKNNGEDKKFLLNCYDANRAAGTAKIIVTGGKFYDFDPANNTAEGEHTNFLAEGYHTEASTVVEEGVEHTVYTVKKD